MEPDQLNAVSMVLLAGGAFAWAGATVTGEFVLLLVGLLVYLAGLGVFLAFVTKEIDRYLEDSIRSGEPAV